MSEPSSAVPEEVTDAWGDEPVASDEVPQRVELDVDQDKLDAWDEVKADYQTDPDAASDATSETDAEEDGAADEAEAESEES